MLRTTLNTLQWGVKDSNLRRRSQQIYSLPPLTAREPPHSFKPTQGFEPWTPRLQITCSRPAELNWRSERYEYYMKYNFMSTPKVKKNDFFSLFYKKFIKIFTKQQKNNSAKKKELSIPLDSSF